MSKDVNQSQPSPPTNAHHLITSPTSPGSPLDQNHSSDDDSYEVPSPTTSEGNQMGYILKYGRSPAGPNSSAALKVRLLEFWDTLNAEQGAEQEAEITYTECGTQTAIDVTKTRKRQRSDSDDEANKENLPSSSPRKMKRSRREHQAVTFLRDAVAQSQEATRLLRYAIKLLEENRV